MAVPDVGLTKVECSDLFDKACSSKVFLGNIRNVLDNVCTSCFCDALHVLFVDTSDSKDTFLL